MIDSGGPGGSEKAGGAGVGRLTSLSVEETNKLRMSLGLRPLRTKLEATASTDKPATERPSSNPEHPARLPPTSIAAAAFLGFADEVDDEESDDEDNDDATAWVERMRRSKEKYEAAASAIGDQSGDSSDQGSIFSGGKTGRASPDLDGVQVRHSGIDDMEAGDEIVMTLADRGVLDDAGEALDEKGVDVLVNMEDREAVATRKSVRLRNGAALRDLQYDPIAEAEALQSGSARTVLRKYDDEHVDAGFRIGKDGFLQVGRTSVGASGSDEAAAHRKRVAESLRKAISGAAADPWLPASLSSSGHDVTRLDSDYLTKDEYAATFRKKKSKNVSRKRKKSRGSRGEVDDDRDGEDGNANEIANSDDGTLRKKRKRKQSSNKKLTNEKNGDGTEDAESEEEYTSRLAMLREAAVAAQVLAAVNEDDDDDDVDHELQESLALARRIAAKSRASSARRVQTGAEGVVKAVGASAAAAAAESHARNDVVADQDVSMDVHAGSALMYSEAEQFVRSIAPRRQDLSDEGSDEEGQIISVAKSAKAQAIFAADARVKNEDTTAPADEVVAEAEFKFEPTPLGLDGFEDVAVRLAQPMGTAHALARLRNLGELGQGREQLGRTRDERLQVPEVGSGRQIQLNYTDDQGRPLTPHESFRLLSYKFHGQGPGKNKKETRLRNQLKAMELRSNSAAGDTPLASVAALKDETRKSGSAHVVLSGAAAIAGTASRALPVLVRDGVRRPQQQEQPVGSASDGSNIDADQNLLDGLAATSYRPAIDGKLPRSEDKVQFILGNGPAGGKRARRS
jgi:U4/U6.U5 tri-snRNP-associated protein 1